MNQKKYIGFVLQFFVASHLLAANNGPIGKVASLAQFSKVSIASLLEIQVETTGVLDDQTRSRLETKYDIKFFGDSESKSLVALGYFGNILALAGEAEISQLKPAGYYEENQVRVDIIGFGNKNPNSRFIENSNPLRLSRYDLSQQGPFQVNILRSGGQPFGKLIFKMPIQSLRSGQACNAQSSVTDRILEVVTQSYAGQKQYHYIRYSFAWSEGLYGQINLPQAKPEGAVRLTDCVFSFGTIDPEMLGLSRL